MLIRICLALLVSVVVLADEPKLESEFIFPLEDWHNHGSAILVCPNGDLLVCWFHGSGERQSDDVVILGARKVKATGQWTAPFLMADTPEFPDTNCTMVIDPKQRLWLMWPTIQANTWESALMKYKVSSDYMQPEGAPKWDYMEVMHVKQAPDFEAKLKAKTEEYVGLPQPWPAPIQKWADGNYAQAADKLTSRLGWFTRAHPKFLADGRLLVGLYSDGFSISLVGITDDLGATWHYSEPIVGGGNIQPSFAVRKDGTIVNYMRDNGPPPKKVHVSESTDRGETWSKVVDHPEFANPGAGLELANLNDGDWVCIFNDLAQGRHSLVVALSDDEGKSWKWKRHLELREPNVASFHYPSITQAPDGTIHASYSYFIDKPADGEVKGKTIKHAQFNKEWIKAGDTK